MSDWAWVVLGYGVAYAAVIAYRVSLRRRLSAVRQRRAAGR